MHINLGLRSVIPSIYSYFFYVWEGKWWKAICCGYNYFTTLALPLLTVDNSLLHCTIRLTQMQNPL